MKIDTTKSALQNFLDLVDSQNPGLSLDPTKVTVSAPQAYSDQNHPAVNSSAVLTAKAGSGFKDSVTVHYGRLPLATEAQSPAAPLAVPYPYPSTDAVLAQAAAYFGFLPSEISWGTAPTLPAAPDTGSSISPTVQSSGSLIYQDGSANIALSLAQPKTSLLMHLDGDLSDVFGHSAALGGNAVLSNTMSRFGSQSLYIPKTTGGLTAMNITDKGTFGFGSGDFTIEWWQYVLTATADFAMVNKGVVTAANTQRAWLEYQNTSFLAKGDGTSTATNIGSGLITGSWQHMAMAKQGSNLRVFQGGVLRGTLSASVWGAVTGPLRFGCGTGTSFDGYISEIRVSRFARYTAAFTPPDAPFTPD